MEVMDGETYYNLSEEFLEKQLEVAEFTRGVYESNPNQLYYMLGDIDEATLCDLQAFTRKYNIPIPVRILWRATRNKLVAYAKILEKYLQVSAYYITSAAYTYYQNLMYKIVCDIAIIEYRFLLVFKKDIPGGQYVHNWQ
jgi:hypothetical protein